MSLKKKIGVTLLALGLLGGCAEDSAAPDGAGRAISPALTRAASCDDLLSSLQEDALAKVDLEVGYLREWFVNGEYNYGYGEPLPPTEGRGLQNDAEGSGEPPASPSDGAAGGDKGGGESPTGHSDTNTQVKGVDEADIVKTDGEHIYVLSGNKLQVLKSWPAAETALVGTFDLGGYGNEMFVDKGRAVVFSYANDLTEAQIKAAGFDAGIYACPVYDGIAVDGAPPPNSGGAEPAGSGDAKGAADAIGGAYYCGPSFTKISVINVTDDAKPKLEREFYFQGYYTSSRRHGDIVRAVLQSSFDQPASVPYFYEVQSAAYAASGGNLTKKQRSALVDAYASVAKAAIKKTKLAEWLPAAGEKIGDTITPIAPDCGNFYTPAAGLTDYGLTSVVGFDMTDKDGAVDTTTILGSASTVYASGDSLVLAQPDWSYQWRETDADFQSDRTSVHLFQVSDGSALSEYEGSGFVPGTVKDQFGLDEKDGILRVATTQTTWPVYRYDGTGGSTSGGGGVSSGGGDTPDSPPPTDVDAGSAMGGGGGSDPLPADGGTELPAMDGGKAPDDPGTETDAGKGEVIEEDAGTVVTPSGPTTKTFVTTLKLATDATGAGELLIEGQTPPLAEGERIFSSRYVGDIAYVVTFRQVDPLFAIDLSDPSSPKVLGELKIPGFSDYMHPLDSTHLLTIGRDSGNWDAGLALQIFDVTDPTKPKLTHKHVFGEGGYSEASYNHKAFTYYDDKKLLAFPYVKYYPEFGSSLELFTVDKTDGFTHLGSVSHTSLVEDQCGSDIPMLDKGDDPVYWECSYQPEVRRGLFISGDDTDYVYSLSWSGILVNDVKDLDTAVATVLLP